MSGGPEVSTDRGLSLQWWYVVAAGTVVWTVFVATLDVGGAMPTGVEDTLTLLALVAWPAIPVAIYLDLRSIRGDAAWRPATKSWVLVSLLWIANVAAGLAYCLRRVSARRGAVPSESWRVGVYAGLVGWVDLLGVSTGVDYGLLREPVLFGPALLVVWLGYPVALYLDVVRVRAFTDLTPNVRVLVALSAVPLLNVLAGSVYVGGRWWYARRAGPTAEPHVPAAGGDGSTGAEPLSPWYRRAAGVFAVYVLLVVAVGLGLSLESDGAWLGLELVGWLPFGLVFTACLHLDLRAVRDVGVPWGGTRYLYYTSALFPGPAFWYLLRRFTKVNRSRSKELLDDAGGGGDDGDVDSDTNDESSTTAVDGTEGRDRIVRGSDRDDSEVDTGFEWGDGTRI